MGKQIIIAGADFSADAIDIPMTIKIAAGQSVTIDGITYSGGDSGTTYELGYVPTTFKEESSATYLESATFNDPWFHLPTAYFQNQAGLKSVKLLTTMQTENDIKAVFMYCSNLEEINGIEKLNTTGATDFRQMFRSCGKLAVVDVSSFDTSDAIYLSYMFTGTALTSLDLSNFETSKVTDMSRMFASCSNLATLILGTGWDMLTGSPDVTDMFYRCNVLTSIIAPNCIASEYATANTQMYALVSAISSSGFASSRSNAPLVISCSNGGTLTGTYANSAWSWVVS